MKRVAPYDVVLAAVVVGESHDPRRCIVLRVRPDGVVVLPCSAQLDLIDENRDFLIRDDRPEFGETGFKKTSYVMHRDPAFVEEPFIKKHYGSLTGDLLREFKDWYGIE